MVRVSNHLFLSSITGARPRPARRHRIRDGSTAAESSSFSPLHSCAVPRRRQFGRRYRRSDITFRRRRHGKGEGRRGITPSSPSISAGRTGSQVQVSLTRRASAGCALRPPAQPWSSSSDFSEEPGRSIWVSRISNIALMSSGARNNRAAILFLIATFVTPHPTMSHLYLKGCLRLSHWQSLCVVHLPRT